jgi:diaminopimelate decarboxylase
VDRDDTEFDLDCLVRRIRIAIHLGCDGHRLPVPRLAIEPGRALVARAGITLYRVVTVNTSRTGPPSLSTAA